MKTKSFTMRIPQELYEQCVKMALSRGKKERRIVSLSETIIDVLKNNININ